MATRRDFYVIIYDIEITASSHNLAIII